MAELDLNSPDVQEAIKKMAQQMVAENHEGLVKNRDQLIAEKRELAEKLKQFEGVDPEKFRNMTKAQEDAERERLMKEKDFDTLLKNQAEKMNAEITAKEQRVNQLTDMLHNEKIHSVAVKAISENKGVPDLLLPHMKSRVRLDENFNVEVLSREGTPLFNTKGEKAGINDLVDEYKSDPVFSRAFDAGVAGGTGARSTGNGVDSSTSDNPFEKDEKTGKWDVEAGSKLRREDPERAKQLAASAGLDTSHWK